MIVLETTSIAKVFSFVVVNENLFKSIALVSYHHFIDSEGIVLPVLLLTSKTISSCG
jgi:hypothetical protein